MLYLFYLNDIHIKIKYNRGTRMFLLKSFFHNRSQKPQLIANTFDNNKIMIFFPCPVFYCQLGLYVHQKLLHTQNTTFIIKLVLIFKMVDEEEIKEKGPSLYSDCLRRESNFLASMHPVTALCVCVCCILYACAIA